MKTNVRRSPALTREGGAASRTGAAEQLRRAVLSCMLWEDGFYEDGKSIADRIAALVPQVDPLLVASIAVEARAKMNLRHVPLLLVREMARLPDHKALVAETLDRVVLRADELSEFLAIYWRGGREKLSAQVKKGLARAFRRFNEYQLAKYDRNNASVRLRDVLFLCHAKPEDKAQERLWKRLVNNELRTPDTWETELSAGKDKRATWERLMAGEKLGALAFLRNLRNMEEAGVDKKAIKRYFNGLDVSRVLPFRFVTAARHAPQWEQELEGLLFRSTKERRVFRGRTVVLVDVSGSMNETVSGRSEVSRIDVACGLAMIAREMCDDAAVYVFSEGMRIVPARRGFALRDVISAQVGGGTYLGGAVTALNEMEGYDRLIVITDEQTADKVPPPVGLGYILNVATEKNGVGYGAWTHIHGWSDAVLDYIHRAEGSAE